MGADYRERVLLGDSSAPTVTPQPLGADTAGGVHPEFIDSGVGVAVRPQVGAKPPMSSETTKTTNGKYPTRKVSADESDPANAPREQHGCTAE